MAALCLWGPGPRPSFGVCWGGTGPPSFWAVVCCRPVPSPRGRRDRLQQMLPAPSRNVKTIFLPVCSLFPDTRIFYEFEHSIPEKDWKMFVRLVGLKENDIEMCEHENPGNLMEQRHQMLRRWKDKRGREASVFRLLAALRKMERQTHLQNIVNRLLAEKILVKSAEAPN